MFDAENKTGFNLVIKRAELVTRLEDRARFHEGRAEFYKEKGDEFVEDVEAIPQSYENSTLGRHEDQLRRSSTMHIAKARMLRFFANHLPETEKIELTRKDLYELELLEA